MNDAPKFAIRLQRTVPSRRRGRASQRLAVKLGTNPERIRTLIARPPGLITKPIEHTDARQILRHFVNEGIEVELIRITPDLGPDVFKTSTNLRLTSIVHRGSEEPDPNWPDASTWDQSPPQDVDKVYAVRLIVRVPPQRIEALVKRLSERLEVNEKRLRKLLARPPGLLSKPVKRATSERITSILSAEGVVVESVRLLDEAEGGPGSPDFDLRLTLDSALMQAHFGDLTSREGQSAGQNLPSPMANEEVSATSSGAMQELSESTTAPLVTGDEDAVATPPPAPMPEKSPAAETTADGGKMATELSEQDRLQPQAERTPAQAATSETTLPPPVATIELDIEPRPRVTETLPTPVEETGGSKADEVGQPVVPEAADPAVAPLSESKPSSALAAAEAASAPTPPATEAELGAPAGDPADQVEESKPPAATVLETKESGAAAGRSQRPAAARIPDGSESTAQPAQAQTASRARKEAGASSAPTTEEPATPSKGSSAADKAAASKTTGATSRSASVAETRTERSAKPSAAAEQGANQTAEAEVSEKTVQPQRVAKKVAPDTVVPAQVTETPTAKGSEVKNKPVSSDNGEQTQAITKRSSEGKAAEAKTKTPRRGPSRKPAQPRSAPAAAVGEKNRPAPQVPVESQPAPSIGTETKPKDAGPEPSKPEVETRTGEASTPAPTSTKGREKAPPPPRDGTSEKTAPVPTGRAGRRRAAAGRKRKAGKASTIEAPQAATPPPDSGSESSERPLPELPPLDLPRTPPPAAMVSAATDTPVVTAAAAMARPAVPRRTIGATTRVETPTPVVPLPRPAQGQESRGLLTLLALDIGVLAVLARSGDLLTSPVGITLVLLFSLLLIGQATLTRDRRPISNLFTALAVVPLIFMFPALVDTLSPWRELGIPYQLIVISLLLLVSSLSVVFSLELDLRRVGLGLAPWPAAQSDATVWWWRAILRPLRGLAIQVGVAASGLLLGAAALRYLQPPAGVGNLLAGTGWVAVLGLLLAALSQEFFFRGLLQRIAGTALGVPVGILVSALLFALLFSTTPFSGAMLFTLLLALISGVVAHFTGSVLGLSLAQMLALLVFLGLMGDPLLCFQGGIDGSCLATVWSDFLGGLR